jgi:hypothetical protein
MGKRINTTLLVRSYQQTGRDFHLSRKWKTGSITDDKEKIRYHRGKGWLIDCVYYGCDLNLLTKTTNEYDVLSKQVESNNPLLVAKKKELDAMTSSIKLLYEKVSDMAVNHISKVFPNNKLFNGKFLLCKTDKEGLALKDEDSKYIYEEVKGFLKFEVKSLCDFISFHGSADYSYNNIQNQKTVKMRGYEVNKDRDILRWFLDEDGNIQNDTNFYKKRTPVEMFLDDIRLNPERVSLPWPITKTTILKPAEYKKNYNKTWQHSNIIPGYDYYEMVRIPVLTMRFKFQTYEQHKKWISYYNSLKRRFEGLSFEVFYMNEDGTVNYEKMISEIDRYISEGVSNPKEIYDKYDNLGRVLIKNQNLQNYINLLRTVKFIMRITQVGVGRFIEEKYPKRKKALLAA